MSRISVLEKKVEELKSYLSLRLADYERRQNGPGSIIDSLQFLTGKIADMKMQLTRIDTDLKDHARHMLPTADHLKSVDDLQKKCDYLKDRFDKKTDELEGYISVHGSVIEQLQLKLEREVENIKKGIDIITFNAGSVRNEFVHHVESNLPKDGKINHTKSTFVLDDYFPEDGVTREKEYGIKKGFGISIPDHLKGKKLEMYVTGDMVFIQEA